MKHTRQIMAFLLTLVLCASMLGDVLCLTEYAHHNCSGEGCSVCVVLAQCDQHLHSAAAVRISDILLCCFMQAVYLTPAITRKAPCKTPVALKVKLLD